MPNQLNSEIGVYFEILKNISLYSRRDQFLLEEKGSRTIIIFFASLEKWEPFELDFCFFTK